MGLNKKIEEMTIENYFDILSTNNPVPGGGSVSGVTGTQGIGLVLLVLNLTLGKEKYAEYKEENEETYRQAVSLFTRLRKSADKDVEAYSKLSLAYKISKVDPNRKNIIGEYTYDATKAPFELMEMCYEGCKLAEKLIGKSNKTAVSDLAVAARCFECASKSAWYNVKINLPNLLNEDDKKYFDEKGREYIEEIEKLAIEICNQVEKMF